MIIGQYPNIPQELLSPIWKKALTWAKEQAPSLPDGEYPIQHKDIYANIHTVETQELSQGAFEVHKEYIDLHFCITGGEIIAHSPRGELQERVAYNAEKDYALFGPTEMCEKITMKPGMFAIFFPEELHMPKVSDGKFNRVQKVVIKIHKDLVVE